MTKKISEKEAYETLHLALLHEEKGPMSDSAKLCAKDALDLFNAGDFDSAYTRARESIRYSVGVFSMAFQFGVYRQGEGV